MKKEQRDKILKALAEDRNDYARECEKRIVAEQGKIVGANYMLQRFLDVLKPEVESEESEEERKNAILNTVKREIKYDKQRIEKDVKAYDLATKVLNKTTEWIPVSERLPESSGDFLVTVANNRYGVLVVMEAYFAHKDEYHTEESKWREFGPNETVIAWMPEPEPYEEEIE